MVTTGDGAGRDERPDGGQGPAGHDTGEHAMSDDVFGRRDGDDATAAGASSPAAAGAGREAGDDVDPTVVDDDLIDRTYGHDEDPTVFGSRRRSRSGRRGAGAVAAADEDDPDGKRRKSWRDRKVLLAAIVLLLIPMLALGGYLLWLNKIVDDNLTHDDLLPVPGKVYAGDVPVDQTRGKGINFLLIGNDAGPDRQGARGDVLIVVHITEDRSKVYMMHIARDFYVPIPGHGMDKINAAYAYGGPQLQTRVVQNVLGGTRIDHVVLIGFDGFKNMTEAIGGVDVNIEQGTKPHDKVGFEDCDFSTGVHHMNGKCGLAFVRQRYELKLGDIDRGKRQMAYIRALAVKGLSSEVVLNPLRLKDYLDAATKNTTVDNSLTTGDLRSLALSMRNIRGSDILSITAPWTGYGTTSGGASIVKMNAPQMLLVGKAMREDKVGQYVAQYETRTQ